MAITIAGTQFNYHDYDPRGDTLFISIDGPLEQLADAYETPEGHTVEYDASGALVAIEFLNARWLLERDGELRITLPEQPAVAGPDELKSVLA
jgi:YD repeat-containing protein